MRFDLDRRILFLCADCWQRIIEAGASEVETMVLHGVMRELAIAAVFRRAAGAAAS